MGSIGREDVKETHTHDRPRQAVILAGGRGTRLLPLTDHLPKPMISFHGRPFLEYLVEQIREQGFSKVLLLLGYLPEIIQDYFGDGRRWGLSIEYSVTDPEFETALRLKAARPLLEEQFLLMYCDNYWPMDIRLMSDRFQGKPDAKAQLTVYTNKDNYTRSNLILDNDHDIVAYDKTRSLENLRGVDIGYVLLKNEVLDLIPAGNVNFEAAVYPQLVAGGWLAGLPTDHRYYSVGSHERLPVTAKFLERQPAIILDRDGVINEKAPKATYVTRWEEFHWLPGAIEAIRLLKEKNYKVIVVTNQAGIARGFMTEQDLSAIHGRMNEELSRHGAMIDAFYHCPHGWDSGCECRKPAPGMLFAAQKDFHLDLSRIYFIGDDERDVEAGRRAGCKTIAVDAGFRLIDAVRRYVL